MPSDSARKKRPYARPTITALAPEQARLFVAAQSNQETVESLNENLQSWLDAVCSNSLIGRTSMPSPLYFSSKKR